MANLTSCLYECEITHQRTQPKKHRVEHKMFSFYLDLDELDTVHSSISLKSPAPIGPNRFPLIGVNQKALYSLFDRDHFDEGDSPLKEKVCAFVRQRQPGLEIHKVRALCNLRFLNYVFNPITVFFCFSRDERLLCAVAEVGNTFGEKKPYLITGNGSDLLQDTQPKNFYVSPFVKLDADVAFKLKQPNDQLVLSVVTEESGVPILAATMTGVRSPLTSGNLLRMTFKYPFVTFFVIAAIHFHALQLWLKKVPFIRKEDNPQLQTGVMRPVPVLRKSQITSGEAHELATNSNR